MFSAKHNGGIRYTECLLNQQSVVQRALPVWKDINFADKRFVEMGCSSFAGYSPPAIFLGASVFESAEPEWDADLFISEPAGKKHLRTFHADLRTLCGERTDLDAVQKRLEGRFSISWCSFIAASITGPADMVMAQSVLEQVFPLEVTFTKLASIQVPAARVLYLVDFDNHYPTLNPFDDLCEVQPASYLERCEDAISGLHVNEVDYLFGEAGLVAATTPLRMIRPHGPVHESWTQHPPSEDLSTQLALFCDPA